MAIVIVVLVAVVVVFVVVARTRTGTLVAHMPKLTLHVYHDSASVILQRRSSSSALHNGPVFERIRSRRSAPLRPFRTSVLQSCCDFGTFGTVPTERYS